MPTETLEYEGRTIAIEELAQTGGSFDDVNTYAGAIYIGLDDGAFYLVEDWSKTIEWAMEKLNVDKIVMPRDSAKIHRIKGGTRTIRRVTEKEALAFYIKEWMYHCDPLNKYLLKAVKAYIPRAERGGKVQVAAWLPRAVWRALVSRAKVERTTPAAQLELLAVAALKPARKPRTPKARKTHGETGQLELATALVEVVRALGEAPNVETLSEARRACSALHQELHSETTYKVAARG